jgi:hypothetical protein
VDQSFGVQIEGLNALARTMRKAGEDLADLKDANRAAGDIVASAAAAMAPRRTGRLASSIRPARAAGRASVMAGRASVPYAPPIHWGWPARHIAAQPFLSNAAQQTESIWLPKYLADVQAALDKVTGA